MTNAGPKLDWNSKNIHVEPDLMHLPKATRNRKINLQAAYTLTMLRSAHTHQSLSIGTAPANSRNFVESDHACISMIYFDNASDNVTLTLYNVTLTSQEPCWHNNKKMVINEVYEFFSIEYRYQQNV